MSNLFTDFSVDVLDKLCWITTNDSVWRDVLCNKSCSSDNSIFAHSNARENSSTSTNPSVAANMDRLTKQHWSIMKVMVI